MKTDIEGLGKIIGDFDGFAIDQWGVLHDGRGVYPGVPEFLLHLQREDKDVLIITNSSKTGSRNIDRLRELFGLVKGVHYTDLVSSAQLLHDWFYTPDARDVNHVSIVSAPEDSTLLDDVPITQVPIEDCDVVLLLSAPPGDMREWIAKLVAVNRPIFVPSSDAASVTVAGLTTGLGPWVTKLLSLGAKVTNFGKPSHGFYAACSGYWRTSLSSSKVLAIGDQLMTDVLGAQGVGWQTALVLTGAGSLTSERVEEVVPDYIVPSLRL